MDIQTSFSPINVESISDNTFKLINKDWMLITAGNTQSFNTMTAGWGGFGELWNKYIVFIFIRPQRHTYKFVEENTDFTLSFFGEEYRKVLNFCGSKSGKDVDKIKATGLIPVQTEKGNIFFQQSRLVLECKKIYFDDLKPENFLASFINKNYPGKDYHRMYIGEITNCFAKL